MEEVYPNPQPTTPPRYRGISYTKPISAAKEAVRTVDLAFKLCGHGQMRNVNGKWVASCPLPDHQDRSPSFTCYLETNSWFCFGCLRGGDVVELYRLAHSYSEREAHVAAANLLAEFGHEVPPRPPSWFRKQERQKPVRDALEEVKVRSAQRRLMRTLGPMVASIRDPQERNAEAQRIWTELEAVARLLVKETN